MVFSQMAGLFIMLLLGYWMNRSRKLLKEAEGVLAQVITKLFLPALMISVFAEQCTLQNLQKYSGWMLWGAVFYLGSILIAMLISKPFAKGKEYAEMVFRYAFGFPNTGGFATPIVLALYGREVFFQYQLFALPGTILCYSWGTPQLMPKAHQGGWLRRLGNLCNPIVESVFVGMILGLTGLGRQLPEMINTTLDNLGSCYSSVALLLVGFVLGDYKIKDLVRNSMVYVFSAIRLLVLPGVFLAILKISGAETMLCVIACLNFACPCGSNTVVFPAAFGQDTRLGAGMILVSSALAVLTIPLICMLANM